jgi:hypothetical protein
MFEASFNIGRLEDEWCLESTVFNSRRGILGAAGHLILTPAKKLLVTRTQNVVNAQPELATFRSLAQHASQLQTLHKQRM